MTYAHTSRPPRVADLARLGALALALGAAVATSGCGGNDAQAQPRPGAQATPWGAPYANQPDIVPPNVRTDRYAAVSAAQIGPPIDAAKGYRVESFGGGVFMVADGNYNTMFVVSDAGVILADAPPQLGAKILSAIREVAPNAPIAAMVYSHSHIDHIGYAGEILKTNPSMRIVAHEETRKLLARAADPARPVPLTTFATQDADFPLVVGNQTLQLRYPGSNHDIGNIGIYHPGRKVLMLVDVVYPGWMMWRRLGLSTDIPGYFHVVKTMSATWDFDTLIAGHFRAGTKADVAQQLEFMTDMHNAIFDAFGKITYGEGLDPADANNPWAASRHWIDRITNHCVNAVAPKWASRLAGFDVWVFDQCMALEQSIRVDGPSLK